MNKLTAEKCREMIHDMNVKREVNGLSIREGRYFEALEIALPVLEQQEMTADSAELLSGWIEWGGGECPVSGCVKVQYRLRSGALGTEPARFLQWEHEGERHDIIAYRVVQQERERGEEE